MLSPVPDLHFFPDQHRYLYRGQWVAYSITTVVCDKTPAQMARIMASKHEWEPRGNTVHGCLEQFLLHGDPGDPGDYGEWVTPLVSHPMWNTWKAVAVEHRLVDDRYSIAGSFDALLQNQKDGR
ncbi:MAG: Synechococcus phage, partial [Cyanobacteriota bacterium]